MSEEEYEYKVERRFTTLDRTISTDPMDEESARVILNWRGSDLERTLYRRRKAGPWEEIS